MKNKLDRLNKLKEWKNTVYISDRQFRDMKKFLPYRADAFSWNTIRFDRELTITQPNHQDSCRIVKSYAHGVSTDTLYLVYNERTDTFIVIRSENEDYGYVLYAFEFEDEKMARNCFHYAIDNLGNTYTNSNLKI